MIEHKTILTPSLIVYTAEIVDAVKQGWEVDLENNAPVIIHQYEAHLSREYDENAVEQPPKPHFTEVRAQNAAKARAARAEKAAQKEKE
jgi:hypothetical protein